jgi:hypothetical protein
MGNQMEEQLIKLLVTIYKKVDILERELQKKPSRHFVSNETYYQELLKEAGLNNK